MYDFHNYFLTPQQDMVVNLVLFAILIIAVMKGTGKISGAGPVVTLLLIASFCVVGRVLLQPIPNVQPVTVTLILVGIYYGSPWAIALSGCIAMSSNLLFLGHGPWTVFQIVGWSLVGITGSALSHKILIDGRIAIARLMTLSVISAFAFDWIVSLSILLNHDYPTFLAYLSNGFLFDVYHAIGNVAFVILLSAPMGDLMTRKGAIKKNRAVISVATS